MGRIDKDDQAKVSKTGYEKEAILKVAGEDLKRRQGEQMSVLDALRRSRKSRGGVGAPLSIPVHLRDGSQIVITDDALKIDQSKAEREAAGETVADDED